MYNVGISGTGSLIGQGIIKSIRNSKFSDEYNLIGFDYFENTVGSFWCSSNYILPDILSKKVSEEEWLWAFERLIIAERLHILFIGVDFELPILAKAKDSLERQTGCKIMVSSQEVIRIGNDKYLTYKFLKDNGLSYPITFLPEELNEGNLQFPLIVKPRVGARSVGVYRVSNMEDLKEKLEKVDNPVIQECIGNENTEYTCGIIYIDDDLKGQISLKRSLKGGHTHISEYSGSTPMEIENYVREIAIKLKPYGSCNLQLRLDNTGVPKLFEINPRHSGTTFMRSLFGFNEVVYILKYTLEGVDLDFELTQGRAIRFYQEELLP